MSKQGTTTNNFLFNKIEIDRGTGILEIINKKLCTACFTHYYRIPHYSVKHLISVPLQSCNNKYMYDFLKNQKLNINGKILSKRSKGRS